MSQTQHAASTDVTDNLKKRYLKLAVLVIVAGIIYPLIYLRQNFELSILEAFNITSKELGQNYAMLGFIYLITYVPSGWLADRVSPRILMSFSLFMAGSLGVWFGTFPSANALMVIFAGWGIAAGLTFWSALIKATTLLAKPEEQGRFFGILDGGRGLIEAALASVAVGMFAYYTNSIGQDTQQALDKVIWLYAGMMLLFAPISYFILDDPKPSANDGINAKDGRNWFRDLASIAKQEKIWLCAICILTGYQLFWATYSFSAYMQNFYGLTAVTVASITVAKLWMRPIGAAAAGFAGDFLNRDYVLSGLLILSSAALAGLILLPAGAGTVVLLGIVMVIGFLTYAIRGIFWSTLDSCKVSNNIKGLAIGLISLVGYSPDLYLPLASGYLFEAYPGKTGYAIYFGGIASTGIVGAFAALRLHYLVNVVK
jgi:sugar phosphate permease